MIGGRSPRPAPAAASALEDSIVELRSVHRRQSEIAEGLVLLRGPAIPELRAEVDSARRGLLGRHRAAFERARDDGGARTALEARLLEDHERFSSSFEQLDWLLGIVAGEPHGGNRQALGQYWRLVLEALERHLAEEERWLRERTTVPLPAPSVR
jgi:hypothetical protein